MNNWTKVSCEFAQQKNYLDELYKVYPIVPNLRRKLDKSVKEEINNAFTSKNNEELVSVLLKSEVFPIKDSYVAFLKHDKGAIKRNPNTINRIAGNLYQMGYDEIIQNCTEPKETNRQIGPMFKQWIDKGTLGAKIIKNPNDFIKSDENCIYNDSDKNMKDLAQKYFGYKRDKGIDFIAKFNNKYVIAEAKFITDFGGHQNGQFDDAIRTMQDSFEDKKVSNQIIPISIMDGVLYIDSNNKMYKYLENNSEQIILSALVLREYLYSI